MNRPTMKKSITIILPALLIITVIRLLWLHYLTTLDYPHPPRAEAGVLDLRDLALNNRQTLRLDGQWEHQVDGRTSLQNVPEKKMGLPCRHLPLKDSTE